MSQKKEEGEKEKKGEASLLPLKKVCIAVRGELNRLPLKQVGFVSSLAFCVLLQALSRKHTAAEHSVSSVLVAELQPIAC